MFSVRLLVLSLGLSVLRISLVRGTGNVGCFFKPDVCRSDEYCYNDYLFGHCASPTSPPDKSHWKPGLAAPIQNLLEQELKRLWLGGYRWHHEYTQCVVQNLLYADRHQLSYDPGFCARVLQMTLPTVTKDILEELEKIDPEDLALIRFNPSIAESHPDFADEIFIPRTQHPIKQHKTTSTLVALPDGGAFEFDETEKKRAATRNPEAVFRANGPSHHLAPSLGQSEKPSAILRSLLNKLNENPPPISEDEDDSDRYPESEIPIVESDLSSDLEQKPVYSEAGTQWVPVNNNNSSSDSVDNDGASSKENVASEVQSAEVLPGNTAGGSEEREPTLLTSRLTSKFSSKRDDGNSQATNEDFWNHENEARPYPEDDDEEDPVDFWEPYAEVSNFHIRQDAEGEPFRRPMRYDTKKPGPTFFIHEPDDDTINDSEKRDGGAEQSLLNLMKLAQLNKNENRLPQFELEAEPLDGDSEERIRTFKPVKVLKGEEEELQDLLLKDVSKPKEDHSGWVYQADHAENRGGWKFGPEGTSHVKSAELSGKSDKREYVRPVNPPKSQEESSPGVTIDVGNSGHFEVVDSTHAYLNLMEGTPTYLEAENIVKKLENLLKLPRGTFSSIRTVPNKVVFKVNPNPQNLNASVVVERAEDLSDTIKKDLGVTIISAGIGDKTQFEVVRKDSNDRKLFILTFVLCGCIAGVLLAVAVVYIVRRHARSRQKLQSLAQPETEASQDYQDLCRQRMQRKNNEKPEPIQVVQQPKRVSSLSQSEASQPSPSSRSSTSSWSEEPVTSNMDISTGHMILSYMEDHLKNKDRLDREWEAMCAYEAEPSSTNAATLPQNVNKNRFPDVLPYDHSRVVLNDLSNVSNSDYINASTITDHDPRNPAYIATQGPLPQTAADFWQMIWEQGSVVIVTLTRLMENGFAMCHRYWPEEGSEVYHIYEVHLVSEHIWCDDYLVRSFYLKNLKTSETRTVTQFHFLSWPENGVPASTKALLEFRRKVNKSYRGRSCPIVSHCSDGSGRTGTYCLIDMVLNRMAKGAKEIDIAATLEHIRDQRVGMVKTKAQFEFVLMAIAEEVHAILKALSQ